MNEVYIYKTDLISEPVKLSQLILLPDVGVFIFHFVANAVSRVFHPFLAGNIECFQAFWLQLEHPGEVLPKQHLQFCIQPNYLQVFGSQLGQRFCVLKQILVSHRPKCTHWNVTNVGEVALPEGFQIEDVIFLWFWKMQYLNWEQQDWGCWWWRCFPSFRFCFRLGLGGWILRKSSFKLGKDILSIIFTIPAFSFHPSSFKCLRSFRDEMFSWVTFVSSYVSCTY